MARTGSHLKELRDVGVQAGGGAGELAEGGLQACRYRGEVLSAEALLQLLHARDARILALEAMLGRT